MASLPYKIPYEYIPFEDDKGKMKGSYNDLVYQVYLRNFDAVVGDVTITPNRSLYVDFSVAYTELGMAMVVPIKDDRGKSPWIFLKPLTTNLWLASGAFFVFTGFAVWVLEHRINEGFRGPALHQLGTIFYFSFSTLVFAHSFVLFLLFFLTSIILFLLSGITTSMAIISSLLVFLLRNRHVLTTMERERRGKVGRYSRRGGRRRRYSRGWRRWEEG